MPTENTALNTSWSFNFGFQAVGTSVSPSVETVSLVAAVEAKKVERAYKTTAATASSLQATQPELSRTPMRLLGKYHAGITSRDLDTSPLPLPSYMLCPLHISTPFLV